MDNKGKFFVTGFDFAELTAFSGSVRRGVYSAKLGSSTFAPAPKTDSNEHTAIAPLLV
jgi:hypothetical protein